MFQGPSLTSGELPERPVGLIERVCPYVAPRSEWLSPLVRPRTCPHQEPLPPLRCVMTSVWPQQLENL